MAGKAVISLTTGLEDPEKVTVAFLVAVGAAEAGRPTLMFQAKEAVRLALDFNLAASNAVSLSAKTVTITPMVAGSTLPIDAKQARIRGPLRGANTTSFATGVTPFDGTIAGVGQGRLAGTPRARHGGPFNVAQRLGQRDVHPLAEVRRRLDVVPRRSILQAI